MKVQNDKGWLRVRFHWQHREYTVYLGLRDTPEQRQALEGHLRSAAGAIACGKFTFEEYFPNSKYALPADGPANYPTVRAFCADWLDTLNVKPSTRAAYNGSINTHILPAIGARRVCDIREHDVARLLKAANVGPARHNAIVSLLHSIFTKAERDKQITDSPMRYIKYAAAPKSAIDPLTYEETKALLSACEGWFQAFLTVLIFTGLRPREALALRWSDIDWKRDVLNVRRTALKGGELGTPKTAASMRAVDMITRVRRALSSQRLLTGFDPSGYIFPSEQHEIRNLDTIRQRDWQPALVRAGLSPRILYQCRHTFATLSLTNGDSPQHVAAMLGHETIDMVVQVYSRWTRTPESRLNDFDNAQGESYAP